ncbi:MAG: HAMP domain-containing protein [Planctomycetes bacterium]|nr:HAMP domain-containing protein [Planctomycetota bacterium]
MMDWVVIHQLPQPALYERLKAALFTVIGLIVMLTLLIALSATYLLKRHLLKLQQTSSRIEAMASGAVTFSILPEESDDEIGRLNRAFNGLYRKLQQHIVDVEYSGQENARLSEVMAHHFQEPVRRLQTFAERLLQRSDLARDADSQISLTYIQEQSARLSLLTRDAQRYLSIDKARVMSTQGADSAEVIAELKESHPHAQNLSITTDGDLPPRHHRQGSLQGADHPAG